MSINSSQPNRSRCRGRVGIVTIRIWLCGDSQNRALEFHASVSARPSEVNASIPAARPDEDQTKRASPFCLLAPMSPHNPKRCKHRNAGSLVRANSTYVLQTCRLQNPMASCARRQSNSVVKQQCQTGQGVHQGSCQCRVYVRPRSRNTDSYVCVANRMTLVTCA